MIVPGFETRKYGPRKTLKTWWLVIDLHRIVGKAVLHSGWKHWYIDSSPGFLFFVVSRAKLLHGGGSCRKT